MKNQDSNPQQPPQYQPPPPPQIIIQQAPRKKPYFLYGCGGCLTTIVLMAAITSMGTKKAIDSTSSRSSTSTTTTQTEPETSSSTNEEPAIEVSAGQLADKYQSNEVAADNAYKDKTVLVTGTIANIGKDIMDDSYVSLKTSNPFLSVKCVFETSEKDKLAQLSNGQTVTVRGICKGGDPLGVTVAYATLQYS